MAEPASWLVIEPGWLVVGADGEELGKVEQVVGDVNADIFDGLVVSRGLLRKNRYLPAERVGAIVDGRVEVALSREEFERLSEHEEPPPHAEIRHDTTDIRPD